MDMERYKSGHLTLHNEHRNWLSCLRKKGSTNTSVAHPWKSDDLQYHRVTTLILFNEK